ncbi:hypothetical protein HKD37_06G016866 [Glycine soja]
MASPPPLPDATDNPPEVMPKKTRQSTRLRSLTTRSLDQPRPIVSVDPTTRRESGPHKDKFHSYLGVVAREKIPIVHATWNDGRMILRIYFLILDLLGHSKYHVKRKFDIPEGENAKKKSNLTSKFVFADNEGQAISEPTVKYGINPATWAEFGKSRQTPNWQKYNDCPHLLSRGGYELLDNKLMDEKRKRREQLPEFTENPSSSIDPPSPILRKEKWKMACTNCYGRMSSTAAKEIAEKIVKQQATQGSFVPHGHKDILNTSIGRPEHPGRVRVVGTGVTISQYFGQASRGSLTSSLSITQAQLADIIDGITDQVQRQMQDAWFREFEAQHTRHLEKMKQELQASIKIELSQIASHQSAPIEPALLQVLGARAQGLAKDPSDVGVDLMGLYVVDGDGTLLVALGKVYDNSFTIHNIPYSDDVVRVNVVKILMGDTEVHFPTLEVRFVDQAIGTFIAWPTHLVRKVTNKDSQKPPPKPVEQPVKGIGVAKDNALVELVKKLYVVYQKPIELSWDGAKFGLPNAKNGFFITHADVTEIILGNTFLNISILQLWMITSIGLAPIYGFLEPHAIHYAKDKRKECEQYITNCVKESHREVYLGPYLNQAYWQLLVLCPRDNIVLWFCSLRKKLDVHIKAAVNSAMNNISSTFEGKENGPAPQWIESKECLLSQPTLLRATEARLTGASSKGGKCAESPPTFICGKRRKNRRKPVMKNILDSGVVNKSGALAPTYPPSKRKSDLRYGTLRVM